MNFSPFGVLISCNGGVHGSQSTPGQQGLRFIWRDDQETGPGVLRASRDSLATVTTRRGTGI